MPLAIKFWATWVAASCAASSPPAINARLTAATAPACTGAAKRPRILAGANISVAPTTPPRPVAKERCSASAPPCSARTLASPAPAPTPSPAMPKRPATPNGPMARNGKTEPTDSPNFRPMVSSYPGAAAKGSRAEAAKPPMILRADFSCSSGNSAEIPVPADSAKPIAPGTRPLANSLTCPPTVGSGGFSFSTPNASGYTSMARSHTSRGFCPFSIGRKVPSGKGRYCGMASQLVGKLKI